MSNSERDAYIVREPVDSWLLPLDGEPGGADLEYDAEFMEMNQAAVGKPGNQFDPAGVPPSWPTVRDLAASLMSRTRDLRVALLWARSQLRIGGLASLPEGVRLLAGLLDQHWDHVHPLPDPDDGDPFARISVISSLAALDGLLGDVRQALISSDRRLGGLRVRDVEIALEKLQPRDDETRRSVTEIKGSLASLEDIATPLRHIVADTEDQIKALQRAMNDRFGIENSVDMKPLRQMVAAVGDVLPEVQAAEPDESQEYTFGEATEGAPAVAPRRGAGVGSVDTRDDAIKAIRLVCEYLERAEPTNPAQLLLRRAEKLMERNFLQLVKDLAPDALAEVARIMGVDPDSISSFDSGSY